MQRYKGRGEHSVHELEQFVEELRKANLEAVSAGQAMQKLCGEILPHLQVIERALLMAQAKLKGTPAGDKLTEAINLIMPTRETAKKGVNFQ